jgi:hypothetical protein
MRILYFLGIIYVLSPLVQCFQPLTPRVRFNTNQRQKKPTSFQHLPSLSSLQWTPSDVDPLVVTGAFWATVRAKVLSAIIGNIIGGIFVTVAGTALASFGMGKLPELLEGIGGGGGTQSAGKKKERVRQPPPSPSSSPPSAPRMPSFFTASSAATLAISVALDLLGDASYAVPFIGDASDIAFGPISGIILYKLYGSNLLAALGIIEEVRPDERKLRGNGLL